jgi:hypothetical protein
MKLLKKKEHNPQNKKSVKSMFNTHDFHHGSYSVLLSVVVIVVALLINLAVGQLPSKYSQIDISNSQLYSIGDDTKKILENLDMDINIYLLFQEGNEDTRLDTLLNRYKDLNDHIKTSYVDPVTNPTFSTKYSSSSSSLSEGSVVVESEKRYSVIAYDDIYVTDYSNYYTTGSYTTDFDGESQLTSAIDYVTSDDLPKAYVLTGHNEIELSDTVTSNLSKQNLDYEDLNLLSSDTVPEDCDVLIINGPTSDLSADEADSIITYLEAGGSAFITASYTTEDMTNFNRILADYGLSTTEGIVLEGDSSKYYSNPLYIFPTIESHDITTPIADSSVPVLMIQTQGLVKSETRSTVETTDLLTTSTSSFAKTLTDGKLSSYEKEDGDVAGPFSLGVAIEEEVSDEATTHLVVISSAYLLDDSITDLTGSNMDLFLNSMNWMCSRESNISIHSKSLIDDTLTASAFQANMAALVFIIILPLGTILVGLIVWLRRRKL